MAFRRVFRLNISHLSIVRDALKESHFTDADWFDLGVELNLPYPDLTNISAKTTIAYYCLLECLSLWLTSANNRTWESLASALERMNQKPAATLIRNTYDDPASQIFQHYSNRISQVSLTDSCIQLLYTEGLITEDAQRKIERCGGSLSDTLRELMITVSDDHSKLRSLGNILMELEESKPLAQDIIKDYDEIINDLSTDQSTVSAGKFFYNAAHQSVFGEIKGSFIVLIDELVLLISQSKSSIEEMKSFLQRFYPELSAELSNADSIEGIMNVVVKNCRVNDISIMKTIVKRFKITEAKPLISDYEEEVKTVCGLLKDFLSQNQPEHFDDFETIQFTLGWEPDEHSLDDISNLLEEAFKELNKRIVIQSSVQDPLQEKVKSIQKLLDLEQERHERDKKNYEQDIKKYEEKILQLQRDFILTEGKIAALTKQHEEVTALREQTQRKSDDVISERDIFTQENNEELQKETLFHFLKEKEAALHEKRDASVQCDFFQSELQNKTIESESTEEFQKLWKLVLFEHEKIKSLLQDKIVQKQLKEEEEKLEKSESDTLTQEQIEELQKEEMQTFSHLMKDKEATLSEEEDLERKIDTSQQELAQAEVDQDEMSVQPDERTNENKLKAEQRKALLLENERLNSLLKNVQMEIYVLKQKQKEHTCSYIRKDDISKLSVILEPVEDEWYHIGQCLEVKESVLTEIKEMTTVDSRLTHVLETWCHEEKRTMKELEEPLKEMGRGDILQALHEFTAENLAMQLTLDKEVQFDYLVPTQDNLEGLSESQIAGKKLFLVQGDKPQLMNWEEYGLRISVPEDSLSASETVEVSVLALVGGHFKFPDNTRLVSAVYAISTSPLLKSLRIRMQHCIDLSDPSLCKYLKFAVAPVHTASLPHHFSLIEGGEFPAYQRYGSIERSKFCLLAIVGEEENGGDTNGQSNGDEDEDSDESGDERGKGKGQRTGGELGEGAGLQGGAGLEGGSDQKENERSTFQLPEDCSEVEPCSTKIVHSHFTGIAKATTYFGQLFYAPKNLMIFTAGKELAVLRQFIKKEYSRPEIRQHISFQLDSSFGCIELVFGSHQVKPITGWTVSPDALPCQIEERELVHFGSNVDPIPPSCLVSIYAKNNPDTVPNLSYAIPLKGLLQSKTIFINRSLGDVLGTTVHMETPEAVNDDTNLGVCAQNALKKQHDEIKNLLATSVPIFRNIAGACTSATIIHSTDYDKIFDDKTGQSLLERADHFINCIMSVVKVCPDQLEVFLNIVVNKGNIAFERIAKLMSQSFNNEVPEHACIKLTGIQKN